MILVFTEVISSTNYADDNTPYIYDKNTKLVIACLLFLQVGKETMYNSTEVKLLGITSDNVLNFDMHVSKLCKKANSEFHALSWVSNYKGQGKLRLVMKSSQYVRYIYTTLDFHNEICKVYIYHILDFHNEICKVYIPNIGFS